MSVLPVRGLDSSYVLHNGAQGRVYKLNANSGKGTLVQRGECFEYQRRLHCVRCLLQVGYETERVGKGLATFLLIGGLTLVQSIVPTQAYPQL